MAVVMLYPGHFWSTIALLGSCVCVFKVWIVQRFSWGCIRLTKNICDMLNEHLKQTLKKQSNEILWLQRYTIIVKEILKISTVLRFLPKKIYVSTFSKPFYHQRFLLKIGRCEWDLCEWGLLAFIKTDRRLSPNLLLNMNEQSVFRVQ